MAVFAQEAKRDFDMDITSSDLKELPESSEELGIHMQLNYKQSVELAEEQAIKTVMQGNNYDLTERRFYYDITSIGIGATKTEFNKSEGAVVKYVDPANLVYSHTNSPYFDDIYYVGEVKAIPINELIREFPDLTESQIDEIISKNNKNNTYRYNSRRSLKDDNMVHVIYFNYKTYNNEVYKIEKTGDNEKDRKNITLKINKIIEKMIIKNPTQWIWSHNRWK